ncbi:class I SAM-dependent methyltransferase [Mycetocola reblochoni]|nr:class I SAM-dependent methyltransferase [Mycetocola reblochoni]
MERELADAGYTVVRHSGAHLQVTFLIDGGDIDHYIDIFTGFFRGEDFCQPFHLRAPVPRSSLLPTVRVEWEGVQVPAPPVPEDWLAACYGADWRTPDPAFHFETPSATRRRYENWFGSFNTGRVHWESYYSSVAAPEHLDGQQRYLRSARALLPAGGSVLDLGTGSGAIAAALAGDGRRVLGVDYSLKAVALARSAGVDAEFLNLNERRRVDQLAVRIRADPSPWSISAAFVLHTLTGETRSAVFGLIRSALRHPSPEPRSAVVAVDTVLDEDAYSFDDPSSWHLPVETLADELEPHGLSFRIERDGVRTTPHGEREFVVGTITLTTPTQEENR